MPGVLDQVREACAWVAGRAGFVQIDRARIPAYAASLPLDRIMRPEHDAASHYLGHGDDTVAFFLTLDAINFGSGYFPHLRKRPGMSGYFTIAASLNDYFAAHGPLAPDELAGMTADECATLFGQDIANQPIRELMSLFAGAWNDLGSYVLKRFGGSYAELVAAAGGSAERLVALLRAMPAFDDVATYEGHAIPFFKRAQLAASDLWIAFDGQGPGAFADLDQLTIFADNLVPHVLRIDGLLRYDDELAARIDAEELIPAGAPEEVELRACAVHAVELIVAELRRVGHAVNAMQLDNLLWSRGQRPKYKQARPRHRTRSLFY
jgi:putative queuosine salvage protein